MKTEKSCGAIVFTHKNDPIQFLIIQHRKDKGGHWDFPKGHVEKGETEEETALREVLEETGLPVDLINGFREEIRYHPAADILKNVVFFLARASSENVMCSPNEIKTYKWLPYEEALKQFTFDNSRDLLKKANEFLDNRKSS
ncbi:MAG TPA: bis(5'-nucleosyl)-tetraphosphatase [Candidatus Nanoarchaeia archaeon]|nr:bis(5'-nucleosyl)-tetraphosphatase [Candidatus Nanoarchaeia archaeon]